MITKLHIYTNGKGQSFCSINLGQGVAIESLRVPLGKLPLTFLHGLHERTVRELVDYVKLHGNAREKAIIQKINL